MFNRVLQDDEREGQLDLNTLLNHFDAYTVCWATVDQVDVLSSWEG